MTHNFDITISETLDQQNIRKQYDFGNNNDSSIKNKFLFRQVCLFVILYIKLEKICVIPKNLGGFRVYFYT